MSKAVNIKFLLKTGKCVSKKLVVLNVGYGEPAMKK